MSIFYSTIAKDALPISEFRVSAGNGVCAENRKPNSKSGEKYILEIREHCDFVDNRFKETGLSLDE